jgi:hypothetical protein
MDEVDLILHPLKSELNWPLGLKTPLDLTLTGETLHGLRWQIPFVLVDDSNQPTHSKFKSHTQIQITRRNSKSRIEIRNHALKYKSRPKFEIKSWSPNSPCMSFKIGVCYLVGIRWTRCATTRCPRSQWG